MVIVKEFRIVMPMTLEEYNIGQLFSVIEISRDITGGGEGIEWLINRPFVNYPLFKGQFNHGQYTQKIYHFDAKLPFIIRTMFPEKSKTATEHAYNAFPYCKVIIKPNIAPDAFNIYVETMHLADRGETENALNLPPDLLAIRQVINVDFVNDVIPGYVYHENEDPSKFRSRNGRGPITGVDWKRTCEPCICVYKLVHIQSNYQFGFNGIIEGFMSKQYPRLFHMANRKMFCTMDRWMNMRIDDIRRLEAETMEQLAAQRNAGQARDLAAVE